MHHDDSHSRFMLRALELAELGVGTTRPNPIVGAVVVKDGRIVGEGFHVHAGGPHAEVEAIAAAGGDARGAALYVTLEPCNHYGRTPPCTKAILEAGIRNVYFASGDPNPTVEGGGADFLRAQGVGCFEGPLSEEARYLNRGFFRWIETGRPWIVAKFACSLDGRIATRTGESKWITGPQARERGHELRRDVDAILVGSGTVLADDPLLTVRSARGEARVTIPPVRIVLDGSGRSPISSRIFSTESEATTLVATTAASPYSWRQTLEERGADVAVLPVDERGWIDLPELLDELGRREIRSVLVEGGATVHGSFFDQRLVNEVWAFLAPMVIGGDSASPAVGGRGIADLAEALRLDRVNLEQLDGDFLIRGLVASAVTSDESIEITSTSVSNH